MKVLICGGRNWMDLSSVVYVLAAFEKENPIIIHGDCRGADRIAGDIAKRLDYEVRVYPAEWDKYGRGAGFIRNQQMLDVENPDMVIVFHNDLENSKGSKDMMRRAEKEGIIILHFRSYDV